MKKCLLPFSFLFVIVIVSCNNGKNHTVDNHIDKAPKTLEDSLMKEIDDGHILGMSKMAKLHRAQQHAKRIIDSIGTLSAKEQKAATNYVLKLTDAIKDLEYADFAMDKWMTEFEMDSAKGNNEQRIRYLTEERMKVERMKEAILNSLQKADSLLNATN